MIKLAVDIDGTMNQTYYNDFINGSDLCKRFNHPYKYDETKISAKDQFQMTDDIYNAYMRINFPVNVQSSRLLPCVEVVLYMLLRTKQFEIVCMTAREDKYDQPNQPYKGYMMKSDTMEWFRNNNLPFDESNTYFGIKDKGLKCKELGIDFLIDDNPNHIQQCKDNGIGCFFPVYPYNKDCADYDNMIFPLKYGWVDLIKYFKYII